MYGLGALTKAYVDSLFMTYAGRAPNQIEYDTWLPKEGISNADIEAYFAQVFGAPKKQTGPPTGFSLSSTVSIGGYDVPVVGLAAAGVAVLFFLSGKGGR